MTLPADPLAWAVKVFQSDQASLYALYRQYLTGNHPMKYDIGRYRRAFGTNFRNFFYNRCATVVDAHADRMRIVGFGSDDEDARRKRLEAGERLTDAQKTLAQLAQDLWDANRMTKRQGQLEKEAFGMGDAYLLVSVHPETGAVQFWPQRADEMRVHYDDMEPDRIDLAAKAWRDEDEHMRLNLYFTDRIEKYRSANRALSGMPTSPKAFVPYEIDGEPWPMPLNITDTVPVFHIANNGGVNAYGESELRDVLPLQDMLNFDLINQGIASSYRIAKQWVLLNYDANDPDAKQALENLQAGLLQMLAIPPNPNGEPQPELAEFSEADMSQFDLVAEKWDIRISRVSRVPVHHLTMTGDFPSGESQRFADAPFVSKIEDRQGERVDVYGEAVTYGLRLTGVDAKPGAIRINWIDPAPLGKAESWDIAEVQKRVGIPRRQILKERGYEPEQILSIEEQDREEAETVTRDMGAGRLPALDEAAD